MEVKSHQYSERGFFYDIGIDSADTFDNRGRWKLRRLSTIMAQLGHTGVGNYLYNLFYVAVASNHTFFVCMVLPSFQLLQNVGGHLFWAFLIYSKISHAMKIQGRKYLFLSKCASVCVPDSTLPICKLQ